MSLKLLLGVNEVYNKNYSYLHQSTWTVRCMETLYGDWVTPWIQFVADIFYYL